MLELTHYQGAGRRVLTGTIWAEYHQSRENLTANTASCGAVPFMTQNMLPESPKAR